MVTYVTLALHEAAAEVVALVVADPASVEAAVAHVIAIAGAPDIVVNNAGIEIVGAIHLLSDADVHRQLDTNVTGVPRLRWPVGDDAQMIVAAKDSMSFEDFEAAMREVLDWRE